MSTISLSFGMHARNWPRIDLSHQNSILSFMFGDFVRSCFGEFQKRVKTVGPYFKLITCSRSQKMIQKFILTEIRFISLKKPT